MKGNVAGELAPPLLSHIGASPLSRLWGAAGRGCAPGLLSLGQTGGAKAGYSSSWPPVAICRPKFEILEKGRAPEGKRQKKRVSDCACMGFPSI